MKKCSKCGEAKELDDFQKDKSKKDGRYPVCKLCRSPLTKTSYAKNRESVRKKAKAKYDADPVTHRAISKKFREEHQEYYKTYLANYYQQNKEQWVGYAANQDKEKVRKRRAVYVAANREKLRAGVRDWFRRNRHAARLQGAKYRMRRSKAENTLTAIEVDQILEVFDHRCGYCLVDLRTLAIEKRTLDHLQPLIHGGSNTADNVVPCCKPCNSRKGSRHIALMARYL